VLRRPFGLKKGEIIGDWRKLHNEKLCNLYSSRNIRAIRMIMSRIRWTGHVERTGATRNRVLVGKPEGKRLPARHRQRWEDIIKMELREIGWSGIDWIHLVQDRDR
jgi:hypothetical protein